MGNVMRISEKKDIMFVGCQWRSAMMHANTRMAGTGVIFPSRSRGGYGWGSGDPAGRMRARRADGWMRHGDRVPKATPREDADGFTSTRLRVKEV